MSATNVGGLFVEIGANTDSGMTTMNLSPAERRIALAMGVPLSDVAALKRAHGRGGLAGVALHGSPRVTSPFPPADD
jgi:hypothetical protein